MKDKKKPEVILALDVDTIESAMDFVDKLYPEIKIFKVGVHLFTAYGPKIIELIRKKGAEVFLDLKYFDIPNTVAQAVRAATRHGVMILTMHILGDEEMIRAAVKAADDEAVKLGIRRPLLIGITVLTSKEATSDDVFVLAKMGIESGLDGVVCSVREAAALRKKIDKDFTIITPGIRANDSAKDDQKRTATVAEAIEAGSNYLVIGRPILQAKNPQEKVEEMLGDVYGAGN